MNFSHEQQQAELGKTLTGEFLQMFDATEKEPIDKPFMQNLLMDIFGTLRSLGFIRENHVSYLDYQADWLTRRRQSLQQIGDLSSFSGSGLLSKIGTFIGVGSVAQLVQQSNLPQYYIPLFAAAGIGGVVILTVAAAIYISITDGTWANKISDKENKYWKEHFKPDVTQQLLTLFRQIKFLVQAYCSNAEEIIRHDELLNMPDDRVKEIISNEILPPDGLKWSPYTITSPQSVTKPS